MNLFRHDESEKKKKKIIFVQRYDIASICNVVSRLILRTDYRSCNEIELSLPNDVNILYICYIYIYYIYIHIMVPQAFDRSSISRALYHVHNIAYMYRLQVNI